MPLVVRVAWYSSGGDRFQLEPSEFNRLDLTSLGGASGALNIGFILADSSVVAPRDTLRAYAQSHPFLDSSAWCAANLPSGFRWYGHYYETVEDEDEDGDPVNQIPTGAVAHICPHCAGSEPIRYMEPNSDGSPATIPRHYRASAPLEELSGTPNPPGFSTVRAPDDWALAAPTATAATGTMVGNMTAPAVPPRRCSRCRQPGHDVRRCTGSAPHIDRIGIEIEGRWAPQRWREINTEVSRQGAGATSDGSIRYVDGQTGMEIQTVPGTVEEALEQLVKWYPEFTDKSCGMHVHLSFRDPTYFTQLSTAKFFEYAAARWAAWGRAQGLSENSEFFDRLSGGNEFCLPQRGSLDDDMTRIDRYRQWNFAAWREHRTVECRLLPMFVHRRLAVAAVQELVSLVEDWLSTHCPEDFGTAEAPLHNFLTEMDAWVPQVILHDIDLAAIVSYTAHTDQHVDAPHVTPRSELPANTRRLTAIPQSVAQYLRTHGVI